MRAPAGRTCETGTRNVVALIVMVVALIVMVVLIVAIVVVVVVVVGGGMRGKWRRKTRVGPSGAAVAHPLV